MTVYFLRFYHRSYVYYSFVGPSALGPIISEIKDPKLEQTVYFPHKDLIFLAKR